MGNWISTLRVFQDTADMLDFPEAGRLAEDILNHAYPTVGETPSGHVDGHSHACTVRHTQLKGADLGPYDIDVPITSPLPEYRHRLRPAHDGTVRWLLDLGQIFVAQAGEEAFAEEPLLYVLTTWFIHHDAHTACRDPRPIRLERY